MFDRLRRRPLARNAAPRRRPQLILEQLEERAVPAIINVNSLADVLNPGPGVVTLRSAIQQVDTGTDTTNTINLTLAGDYKITLHGTPGETDNQAGEFAITPTAGNLTIVNTSGGQVVVDGNHLSRVFDVNPNFDPANPTPKFLVTLQGFTITNGVAVDPGNLDGPNSSGGGVRDQGNASLTLNNVTITGNTASADGGGVSMENLVSVPWTLTVNDSVISDNHAGDAGGGLETDGSGKVFVNSGTIISGNTCNNQGGGIWLDAIQDGADFQSANLTVTGTLISNNAALNTGANDGGGVGNAGNGTVEIVSSTIEYNSTGGIGGGYGFFQGQAVGALQVFNSIFLGNYSAGGGGAIATGGTTSLIVSSILQGNSTAGTGGGVFADGAQLLLENSVVAGNASQGNGGGVEMETSGTGANASVIVNTTIAFNSAVNANGGQVGGGIDVAGAGLFTGNLTLLNDTINGNYAITGGGVANQSTVLVDVQNTIIAGNNATNEGPDYDFTNGVGFTSLGGNVVGTNNNGDPTFTQATDQTGTLAHPLDPLLGPLQDNGGPTVGSPGMTVVLYTEAFRRGSPALAKGVSAGAPPVDARGFARPDLAGEAVDVGAYELQAGTQNVFFYVGTDHSLHESGVTTPLSPAGTILSASAVTDNAGNDDVYVITTAGHQLWEHTTVWSQVSAGSYQQISATTNAHGYVEVFAVGTDNSLTVFSPAGATVLSPAGTILSISATTDALGNDDVFAVTADHHLWEHSPAGWQLLSVGSFQQISAGLNTGGQAEAFAVLTDNSLWEYNPAIGGSNFIQLSGPHTYLSVSAGAADTAFAIMANHQLEEFQLGVGTLISVGDWDQISGTQTADGKAEVFGVLGDTSLWEFNPNLGGDGFQMLVPSGALSAAAPARR